MAAPTSPTTRLEAFSDGVIAVIITIMVLELKVPHSNGLAGLLSVLPTLGIYALSFTFTSIYWINHHHLVRRTEEADQAILYANLFFLFCLSLLPFFTSYLIDMKMDSFSVAVYCFSMVVTGFSFMLLRLAIGWRLRHSGTLKSEDKAAEYKHWTSLALYLIAIPLAFYHSYSALGIVALVTLVWIYPTAHTTRHGDGSGHPAHPSQQS
jgi:uncharacterized membrane protein